jgi:predicted metalloprotease with PDZ domain
VRLTNIDALDLQLFDCDYDLTFTVLFLNADEDVYARYGARDARGPDALQSLDGLRYTMESVLAMHQRPGKLYAPREKGSPTTIRQLAGRFRRCFHCHQVQETLNANLRRKGQWQRERAWRYPPTETIGLTFEVDRGNVVKKVVPGSAAAKAGLAAGDVVRRLGEVPIHSIADAQFALDRSPAQGQQKLTWERAGKEESAALTLAEGWRKNDVSWRPSMRRMIPRLPLFGRDLTEAERKAAGLAPKRLAFRQRSPVNGQAQAAGVRPGDVILGVDGRELLGLDADDFRDWIRREYLIGDTVKIDVLRDGKRVSVPFTFR